MRKQRTDYNKWITRDLREDYKIKILNGELYQSDKAVYICEKHGEYEQTITSHINRHARCPKCGQERFRNYGNGLNWMVN